MREKIKVIEYIPRIVDAGAETLVKNYVLGLNKDIFDVCLLVTDMPCSYSKSANVRELVNNGVKIYAPYPIVRDSFVNKLYRKVRRILLPKKWINEHATIYVDNVISTIRPDVIHIHMRIGRLIENIDKLTGVKLFYSCYSLPERYFNENELKGELMAAKYLVEHNDLRFIAMHDEMRKELNSLFGVNNTTILRNTIDVEAFKNVPLSQAELRKSYGIPQNAFVIGHVGRMFYIKNQLFLIDVFVEVMKMCPQAFLLLVGEGEDRQKILDKIQVCGIANKTLILSNVYNLNVVYKVMDVFVFPSLLEGLPNVCIEAQATGLRCVISSAVTKDVCLSSNAIQMDIHKSPMEWANVILDENIKGEKGSDMSEYDLPQAVHQLEKIYTE